jgi:hypothetical protein
MKIFLTIFLACIFFFSPSQAAPFQIDTKNKHTNVPREIPGFQYWYGDINYGLIIYLGTEDLGGFETELHLRFQNKLITSVLLILGPSGLNDENCMREYKKVLKIMNSKYGHYNSQKVEKDPLIDELLAVSVCHPIQVGLYLAITTWQIKGRTIEAVIIGDDDGFNIEIEYRYRPHIDRSLEKLKKAL